MKDKWEEIYLDEQKVPFYSNEKIFSKRLNKLDIFTFPKNARILDLGCGSGNLSKVLLDNSFNNIYSVDINFNLLKYGKNNKGLKNIVNSDIVNLPFKNKKFDVVFVVGVLHHLKTLKEYEKVIKTVKNILREDGFFCICEPVNTFIMKIFRFLLQSKIADFFSFSKSKKKLYLLEKTEFDFWIDNQNIFLNILKKEGFQKSFFKYGFIKFFSKYKRGII